MPDREPLTFVPNADGDMTAAPHTNGAVPASESAKASLTRRRLIVGGLVVFLGLWAFAITYSVTAGGRSPERLDDPTARVVETACVGAQHTLSALPQVSAKAPAPARATLITREDAILTTMVDHLRAVHPNQKTPATALTDWLGDWERLITARQDYANDLRTDGNNARFVEPATAGVDPIVDKMNDWILEQGTRTDACNTGQLQAEVIFGLRTYGPASNT
ncbi:MAG: hypothetical protein ACLPVY_07245 [Acidimicrobiia bacterium]